LKSVIVLTDKRVLFATIESEKGVFAPEDKVGPDYSIVVNSWYFNEVYLGMVSKAQNAVVGKFMTDYGGLSFSLSQPHFWDCFGVMDTHTKKLFVNFMSKIMSVCNGKQVLDGPELNEDGKDFAVTKRYFPSSTEKPLVVFESCNAMGCWDQFTSLVTCGYFPVKAKSEIMLTSERVWMCVREIPQKTCVTRDPNEILIVAPLEAIEGSRVIGDAAYCNPACCFDPMDARVALELPVKDFGYPLYLWRSVTNPIQGLMDNDEEVLRFRKIMSVLSYANAQGEIGILPDKVNENFQKKFVIDEDTNAEDVHIKMEA
jgi:hypothetical protein